MPLHKRQNANVYATLGYFVLKSPQQQLTKRADFFFVHFNSSPSEKIHLKWRWCGMFTCSNCATRPGGTTTLMAVCSWYLLVNYTLHDEEAISGCIL